MKIKLWLAACLITISACGTVKKSGKSGFTDNRINNIAWGIASYKGRALDAKNFPNGMPTIMFNVTDGKISGNDGCNSFMGLATYTNASMKIGAVASTKMACPNNPLQTGLYEIFASGTITYHLDNDILRLYVNDAEVLSLKEKQ